MTEQTNFIKIGDITTCATGKMSAFIFEHEFSWILDVMGEEIELPYMDVGGYLTTGGYNALKAVPFQLRCEEFDFHLPRCTDFFFQFGLEPTTVESLDTQLTRKIGDPLNELRFKAKGFVEQWLDEPERVWCEVSCILEFQEIIIKETECVDEAKYICDLIGVDEVVYIGPDLNGGSRYIYKGDALI